MFKFLPSSTATMFILMATFRVDLDTHLIHDSLSPPKSPSQMASQSSLAFFPKSMVVANELTDRRTHKTTTKLNWHQ